jgi:hypothetical protein
VYSLPAFLVTEHVQLPRTVFYGAYEDEIRAFLIWQNT